MSYGSRPLLSRRTLLQYTGMAAAALPLRAANAIDVAASADVIHANLNENAFGPSPAVVPAITQQFGRLSRYADAELADRFIRQIAAHESVSPEQVVLGEILGALGLYLGSKGGPGGEFVYSVPGYLALIDAASHVGGVGFPVPLNAQFENDLPALEAKLSTKTRAVYLINPHNPTGTVSDPGAFHGFLETASQRAPVIVDEAYLEYTSDFEQRSAVSLVRQGANVLVFRTFDKIYGLAGLPIGYTLAPASLARQLRANGLGDAEGLGRLNLVAASAALDDQQHVRQVRSLVEGERKKWMAVLDSLGFEHTPSVTNFVFFNGHEAQTSLAQKLRSKAIEIGRTFPPYSNWARITIGTPAENKRIQQALQALAVG